MFEFYEVSEIITSIPRRRTSLLDLIKVMQKSLSLGSETAEERPPLPVTPPPPPPHPEYPYKRKYKFSSRQSSTETNERPRLDSTKSLESHDSFHASTSSPINSTDQTSYTSNKTSNQVPYVERLSNFNLKSYSK